MYNNNIDFTYYIHYETNGYDFCLSMFTGATHTKAFKRLKGKASETFCHTWQVKHQVGISEKDKSRSRVDDVVDSRLLNVGHVAQNGEDQNSSQEASQSVYNASDDGVPAKRG